MNNDPPQTMERAAGQATRCLTNVLRGRAKRVPQRLPKSVRLWMHWIACLGACSLTQGCASALFTAQTAADHAGGDAATGSVSDGNSLARQVGARASGSREDADRRAATQSELRVLHHSAVSWVASTNVPRGSGERLPSVFVEPMSLDFDDVATGGKVSLRTMADRITAVTGVPVRLQPDVYGNAEASPRATAPPTAVPLPGIGGVNGTPGPANLGAVLPSFGPMAAGNAPAATGGGSGPVEISIHAVPMRWSGTLEGYLDMITDRLGLAWEYRDGVAVIERFRTEYFEIASLDGEVDYKFGASGNDQASSNSAATGSGGGAVTSANSSNEVSEHGKSNVTVSILATLQQMIREAPGSSVVRLDGSGRIALTSTKDILARARDFVRTENETLLRQAQVQFDIYSVTRSQDDERGIDWEAVLSALGGAYVGTVAAPTSLVGATAGNIGVTILTPTASGVRNSVTTHFGGSSAILKMLSEFGGSTQHREVSLLALNRTWDRKSSVGGRAYVSSTVPGASSTAGVGAPGLVTSTVTTGDRYLAQPYILDNDTVLLKFGIGLSSLVNIANFTSGTGATEQTVQTPETTAVDDQATVALKAGQILVITGLSRVVSSTERRALSDQAPILFGGTRTDSRMREEFVIFVRPTIL